MNLDNVKYFDIGCHCLGYVLRFNIKVDDFFVYNMQVYMLNFWLYQDNVLSVYPFKYVFWVDMVDP